MAFFQLNFLKIEVLDSILNLFIPHSNNDLKFILRSFFCLYQTNNHQKIKHLIRF